jgi:hypothetical protein
MVESSFCPLSVAVAVVPAADAGNPAAGVVSDKRLSSRGIDFPLEKPEDMHKAECGAKSVNASM